MQFTFNSIQMGFSYDPKSHIFGPKVAYSTIFQAYFKKKPWKSVKTISERFSWILLEKL